MSKAEPKQVTCTPVTSSMAKGVGYDAANKILVVQFNNGRTCRYRGVNGPTYTNIMTAPSIGKALLVVINAKLDGKPVYPCEELIVEQAGPVQ